jgi:hypothetical protein
MNGFAATLEIAARLSIHSFGNRESPAETAQRETAQSVTGVTAVC